MSLRDFFALYALVGLACAIAVFRRAPARGAGALLSALATIPLWPLWAPFALAPPSARSKERRATPESAAVVARVERALADAVAAVAETPMSGIFTERTAARIAAEVARVANRLAGLSALAEQSGFDRAASESRVDELARSGASDRAVATARLQHDSRVRLAELRAADARALDELADLLEALRTQLLLARYEGSPADDASAIVSEVWARLEGLGAAIDPGGAIAAR
ncbi:MAG TPA: hypothetical protein VLT33_42295 [Labilithrix sp.]|nr:hypothetical protein [Labilithrix sp.]